MALVKKRFDLRKIIHRSYVIPDHVIVELHPCFRIKKMLLSKTPAKA